MMEAGQFRMRSAGPQGGDRNAFFPLVDALRALAALSVVTLHVIAHTNWTAFPTSGPLSAFRQGAVGVDLFFVISGFVVLYNAFAIKTQYPNHFRRVFAFRRLARIVPLYYLTAIAYVVFVDDNHVLRDVPFAITHLASHAAFVYIFNFDTFSSIDGVNWTIAVEMQFYVVIMLTAVLFLRWRGAILLIPAAALLSIAWRYCAYAALHGPSPVAEYHLFIVSAQLPGRLDEFAFGMALAIGLWRIEPMPRLAANFVGAVLLVAASIGLYFAFAPTAVQDQALTFALFQTKVGLSFLMLVAAACLVRSRILMVVSTPLRYVGKISYGVYLWHLPILMLVAERGWAPAVVLIVTMTLTIAVSAASWHLFEYPLTRLVRRSTVVSVAHGQNVPPAIG